jgi:hypothetical protein
METKNGTKNPILKTLKDGDVVMIYIPFPSGQSARQIVRLKNIKYLPADDKFDFDWLDFDCDVLYVNQRTHKDVLQCWGNCVSIAEVIPADLIEITARQNDMWLWDLYQLSDAELEYRQNYL